MDLALFGSGPSQILLNAATTAAQASSFFCVQGCCTFGMQVTITGSPSACIVKLFGSNDGVTVGTAAIATWDLAAPKVTGDFIFAVDKTVQYVKAVLDTITGGTAPTVSATISGGTMGLALYGSGASQPFTITVQDQTLTICTQGCRNFGLQCVTTGSPTLVVKAFGSDDGTTVGTTELGKWDSASQASGDVVFIVDKPVQYVILKATSYTGGTAPTAKAYLSGV